MIALLVWLSAPASGQDASGDIPSAFKNDLQRCAHIMPIEGLKLERSVQEILLVQVEQTTARSKRQRRKVEATAELARTKIMIFDALIANERAQLNELETQMRNAEPNLVLPTLSLDSCVQTATLFGVSKLQLPDS